MAERKELYTLADYIKLLRDNGYWERADTLQKAWDEWRGKQK